MFFLNDEETMIDQISQTLCNSNDSEEICYNTSSYTSSIKYNEEQEPCIYSKMWTLKIKPPTYNDALNFINKLKNIHCHSNLQFKHDNVIENIRKDLLSLSLPVNSFNFFASESNIILEPLSRPPSYLMAFEWLKARNLKCKRKIKFNFVESNKRKGILTPESITKSMLLKKHNHSTPNFSQGKFQTSLSYPSIKKENKYFKSKRKLSTLFLDSINVRYIVLLSVSVDNCIIFKKFLKYFRQKQVMIQKLNFSIL